MPLRLAVNGNASGRDWLYASFGDRRFPARLTVANDGTEPAEVELRMRPDSGARVVIADPMLRIAPGATAETAIHAETTSVTNDDTVIEALVGGAVVASFRFNVMTFESESYFHSLVPKPPAA